VDAQRSLWQTLDAWKPLEVSQGFDDKLYARIAQHQAEPWYQRGFRRMWQFSTPFSFWKPALSVGAVAAVLAVVAVTRMQDPKPSPVQPVAEKQEQRINIQEVQQALDDLNLLTPSNSPSPL
jgi:hypothetical protein